MSYHRSYHYGLSGAWKTPGLVPGKGRGKSEGCSGKDRTQACGMSEVVQRLVDSVQRDLLPNKAVEGKPAGSVEARQSHEVDPGNAAAIVAAEDSFAPIGQVEWVESHWHTFGRHADDNRLATAADEPRKHLDSSWQPDCLEGMVGASADDGVDMIYEVRIVSAEDVGGAQIAREREAFFRDVHREDGAGPDQAQPEQYRLPNAAASDHDGGIAGAYVGRVGNGTDAGRNGAADQCGDGEGNAVRNGNGRGLRHDRRLRECAEPEKGVDGRFVPAQEGGAVGQRVIRSPRTRAEPGSSLRALLTPAAGANQERTTWSPGRMSLTLGPTVSTTPAPSWPRTSGPSTVHSPATTCRSEWHTPLARSLTRTRSPLTSMRFSSSASSGSPGRTKTWA